jgi:hypothetical protein
MDSALAEFEYTVTDQEETFCRVLALENDLYKAWQTAGYHELATIPNMRREALKLANQERMVERTEYYQMQLRKKLDVRDERILAELAAIAFSDPMDAFHPDGVPKNLTEIPAHARAAIKEYMITEGMDGVNYTLKNHDKLKALQMLVNIKNLDRDNKRERAPKVILEFDTPPVAVKPVIEVTTDGNNGSDPT